MNKVVTINLNQNAYQLEEEGYEALRAYLEKAASKLTDNPDKDEIMADFEQAIADKCAKYLTKGKTVITSAEIAEVLAAMGPVEDTDADTKKTHASPAGPKRLFKIREGAVIEGVCNGIAAYFDLDATIVRVAFIILTVITGGAWIIAYILMAIFMPEARTAEDIATAQGKAFNAQTLLDEAHERYEYWKKFGKEQTEQWKGTHAHAYAAAKTDAALKKVAWKYDQAAWKRTPTPEDIEHWKGGGSRRFGRFMAGWLGAIGILLMIALGVVWVWQIVTVFTGGLVFGYFKGVSIGAVALLVSAFFYVIFLPLQSVVGDLLSYAKSYQRYPAVWGKIFALLLWFGALGTIWYLAHTDAKIATDIVRMYQDVTHYFGA